MKLRFTTSPPRREDGTLLPALLCALLAAGLVAQFILVRSPDLPPESIGRVAMTTLNATIPPVVVPSVIGTRPIFSPTRAPGTTTVTTQGETTGPIDGAVVAGAITRRGSARVFLKQPDGKILTVPLGRAYAGWRLVAVTSDGVRLTRAHRAVTIPFGSAAPTKPTKGEGDNDASSDE